MGKGRQKTPTGRHLSDHHDHHHHGGGGGGSSGGISSEESTERSDKVLLSSRSTSTSSSSSSPSCFGKVFVSLRRKCEMAALVFLYGLPLSAGGPLVDLFYGRRRSAEGVELETQTQIVLEIGRLVREERNFDVVEAMRKDVNKARRWFERWLRQPMHRKVKAENVSIPAGGGRGGGKAWLNVRVYTPEELVGSHVPLPVLLYFHGGGFVIGNLNTVEGWLTHVCHWSKCVVISVDYRLAPENPHPAAIEDAVSCFQWVVDHAEERGWDSSKIAVGGDSAGGSIAAVLAQQALARKFQVKPCFQLLLFPSTYLGPRRPGFKSIEEFGKEDYYTMPFKSMIYFRNAYLGPDKDGLDVTVSPLVAEDHVLRDLPPAYFGLCHFDVLRDEGREYARRLKESGVSVCLEEWRAHHGIIYLYRKVGYAKESLKGVASHLRRHMYPAKL
ncbi:alpha/beta hydrolase [Chloropicon primus]|uniref:Alpha/beta hydrolase n=2 Tax=Chloropicon primus TaxID=1764295 RepID=A0A5B8MUC6_9CHLO|nr:alpha/beta hydrolase [Chloropicon primus]UPR02254.1 alpha/beta hydrolase [Chloropicon primus]|eukprot:QDZ23040.1 alpha/beta hydrolase [Chloropicon primus]